VIVQQGSRRDAIRSAGSRLFFADGTLYIRPTTPVPFVVTTGFGTNETTSGWHRMPTFVQHSAISDPGLLVPALSTMPQARARVWHPIGAGGETE